MTMMFLFSHVTQFKGIEENQGLTNFDNAAGVKTNNLKTSRIPAVIMRATRISFCMHCDVTYYMRCAGARLIERAWDG